MQLKQALFVMAVLLFGGHERAHGDTTAAMSCWPEFTSINMDVAKLNSEINFSYYSQNVEGLYLTDVKGLLSLKNEKLSLEAKYSDGWGLAFTVFAVMAFEDQKLIYFEDFSKGCTSPGINMFPSDHEILMNLKISRKSIENLKVIIWAR